MEFKEANKLLEFKKANKLLYRGYLYILFLIIDAIVAFIGTLPIAARFSSTYSPNALLLTVALFVGEVVVFIIAGVLLFWLYLFRGYKALHRLGIRWAWWMAWGPIIWAVLGIVTAIILALVSQPYAESIDQLPVGGEWVWYILSVLGMFLILLLILGAFGLFLTIAHILFLHDMHRRTAIEKFRTAYILLIIGLVIGVIPLIGGLGGTVLVVQYLVEMLAYEEASEWTPPVPQAPQPQSSISA